MSIAVMSWVWKYSAEKGSALLLLLAIADFADEKGIAFPAIQTLADKIRMTTRNTQILVDKLISTGSLEVHRGKGPRGCNLFRVKGLQGELFNAEGVKKSPVGGETAISPEPSVELSKEPSRRAKRATSLPDGFGISEPVRAWAATKGFTSFLDAHLEYFLSYAKSNGKTYVDWDQALMNCIRADWGGVRKQLLQGKPLSLPAAVPTCEWRGATFNPGTEPCGMPDAVSSPSYGGRKLCPHHKRQVEDVRRAPMPDHIREQLRLPKKVSA